MKKRRDTQKNRLKAIRRQISKEIWQKNGVNANEKSGIILRKSYVNTAKLIEK
jgi:hypothetical protein